MRSIRLGAETSRISQPTRVDFSWPAFLIWPTIAWVGYSFDSTMTTSLVVDALRMAIANKHPSPGLIFHSDQGSQYYSHVFQEFLLHQDISGSMSERGQCWDNAPAESFWATLKRETLPLSGCFSSRKEAQDTVTRWISYYNGTRPHSQLGMRSPYQFRLRAQAL